MRIYLLQNSSHRIDESVSSVLESMSIGFDYIDLPANHEEILVVFRELEPGMIILPSLWEDLFCVKILQEIALLNTPFEAVIAGQVPEMPSLVTAFNEGLAAFLETPVTEAKLRQILSRVEKMLYKKQNHVELEKKLSNISALSIPHERSRAMSDKNHLLGKALIDMANKKNPFTERSIEVLLVSSSKAQQNKLENTLKSIGILSTKSYGFKDASEKIKEKEFPIVISDAVLPDGDITFLTSRLQKICKKMPYIIAWSSSPDKAADLLKPENKIDEVMIKPGPETGTESILPSIATVLYRNLSLAQRC